MSAYSEYKVGAISEDEYKSAMRRECEDKDPYDRHTCRDCGSYKDCKRQVCLIGMPQCEQYAEDDIFEDEWEVNEALQNKEFLEYNYEWSNVEDILTDFGEDSILKDYREWKNEEGTD